MSKAPPLDRLVPAYIRRFQAYIPSKPDQELKKLYGCSRLYRLNNNENALGPPHGAQQVIRAFPPPRLQSTPAETPTICAASWLNASAWLRSNSSWETAPMR